MLASVATRIFFFIFRVNLQWLKLQFPLRRSYLHLNLHFRSSHHLQLSYHCSDPNFFDELARKPFLRRLTLCQIALASARKPYRRVFLSPQENGDFSAIYVARWPRDEEGKESLSAVFPRASLFPSPPPLPPLSLLVEMPATQATVQGCSL